jgi:four helix bundle protein
MEKGENQKRCDLEERTERFAKRVRAFARTLPRTLTNIDDVRQLGRASGSVAANYIEANEALSPKDRRMRVKIARKEAKEARLWLRLVHTGSDRAIDAECAALVQEATELMNILGAILRNLGGGDP